MKTKFAFLIRLFSFIADVFIVAFFIFVAYGLVTQDKHSSIGTGIYIKDKKYLD